MKAFEIPLSTQLDINRARWIDALRHNGHRQICRTWSSPAGGVCAAGLAMELAAGGPFVAGVLAVAKGSAFLGMRSLCDKGLTEDNDAPGSTFDQIADHAEAGRYW